MAKKAISITLDTDNLTWLKGRAVAERMRSISELIDRLIGEARSAGRGPIKSVVGTIDIDPSDPLLERTGEVIRAEFERSLSRPLFIEGRLSRASRPPVKKRRG